MMLRTNLWTCAVLLLTVLGCTGEAPMFQPASEGSDTSQPSAPKVKAPQVSLAPAGEATPPLDGGRVESTMPKGWKFLPRSNDYLFAAYYEDKTGIPRLVLRESEAADIPNTSSADAAKKLATKITEEVGSDKDSALTVVHVGDHWFVRYEKVMSFRSLSARGVFLETVRSGKRYSIELLVYVDEKEKFLPALYRFAADLKVETAEEPEDEKELVAPEEDKAAEETSPEEAGDKPTEEEK